VFPALASRCSQFIHCDAARTLAKDGDSRDRLVDFLLAAIDFGNDPGDRPAVASDEERLPALYIIEKSR
jgi:hypothetical protein